MDRQYSSTSRLTAMDRQKVDLAKVDNSYSALSCTLRTQLGLSRILQAASKELLTIATMFTWRSG